MIRPPIIRVEVPQDVVQQCSTAPAADEYVMSNAFAKFCPSSCEVPICSALVSRIMASTVMVLVAPAKRSPLVLRPGTTGMASTSVMNAS